MKLQSIPQHNLQAAVAILSPYCGDLSPTALVKALRSYDPNPTRSAERFLTKHQAAELLGVTHFTVTRWAREGTIPAKRIGNGWRFPLSKLEALGDGTGGEG